MFSQFFLLEFEVATYMIRNFRFIPKMIQKVIATNGIDRDNTIPFAAITF